MGKVSRLWETWHACNVLYFGGKLKAPEAIVITRAKGYDGKLHVTVSEHGRILRNKIYISAHTRDTLGTLLHEMVHQYQAFVLDDEELDHGPTFRPFAKYLERVTRLRIR